VIAQPVTGIALAYHVGYKLTERWIFWSAVLYVRSLLAPRRVDADEATKFGPGERRSWRTPAAPSIITFFGGGLSSAFSRLFRHAGHFWLMITRPS